MMVDTYFAEFVDDDGHAPAVIGGQDAIEQGRFAGAEKSSEDCDRYPVIVVVCHAINRSVPAKNNNGVELSQPGGNCISVSLAEEST